MPIIIFFLFSTIVNDFQVLQNEAYDGSVDWWALGVLMYEMLVGRVSEKSLKKKKVNENWKLLMLPVHFLFRHLLTMVTEMTTLTSCSTTSWKVQ